MYCSEQKTERTGQMLPRCRTPKIRYDTATSPINPKTVKFRQNLSRIQAEASLTQGFGIGEASSEVLISLRSARRNVSRNYVAYGRGRHATLPFCYHNKRYHMKGGGRVLGRRTVMYSLYISSLYLELSLV
jgi:hypothetical protein